MWNEGAYLEQVLKWGIWCRGEYNQSPKCESIWKPRSKVKCYEQLSPWLQNLFGIGEMMDSLKDGLVIMEIIHFDFMSINGSRKSKGTYRKSKYFK